MPDAALLLHISRADPESLGALLDLYQHLIPGDDRPTGKHARAILERFLTYPGSAIFLGHTGGALVASCTLVVIPNLTRGGSPYGLIENVVTHTDHRNKGHGHAMLDHACASAWADGCYKVMLLTGSTNAPTLTFYQSAGFEQTKTGFQRRRRPARI